MAAFMSLNAAPLNEKSCRQQEMRHRFWCRKTAPWVAAFSVRIYYGGPKTAPNSVPKTGTEFGVGFIGGSATLDPKGDRSPTPERIPDSVPNSGRMYARIAAAFPQVASSGLRLCADFLQRRMKCATPNEISIRCHLGPSAWTPHRAEQLPQPSGAEGSFKKRCRLAALEMVSLFLCK